MMSLVATGGGLVFGGDVEGRFKALDDKTGKVLWETDLGSPVSGYPITFAVDGKQYVAVTPARRWSRQPRVRVTPGARGRFGRRARRRVRAAVAGRHACGQIGEGAGR